MVNDKMVSGADKVAEALQTHYETAYSRPLFPDIASTLLAWCGPDPSSVLEEIELNGANMASALGRLSERSASGPDGVPAILLKKCSDAVLRPLLTLWRSSIEAGYVPSLHKEGVITPIYKGGSRGDCKSYRPVVLTSHISKVFERVVADQLVNYLESEGYLSDNQHSFRKGRSCASQLLQHYYSILRMMEAGADVDVTYLDFSKAFDKVDLGVLLVKLRTMGIRGAVLTWLESFLMNRRQKVVVEGSSSCWNRVVSGVPQGTVLGPILFLAHVVDIDIGVGSTVSCFADDTRVIRAVRSEEDAKELQKDLDTIYSWAARSNMKFNCDKFKVLHYAIDRENSVAHSYKSPDGSEIELVEKVRDLGVLMTSNGKFAQHIDHAVRKARKMMGWILRTFATRDPEPLLVLYRAMVLPHLEYCCQVWSPVALGSVRKLEYVQRTFTARLAGLRDLNYWER